MLESRHNIATENKTTLLTLFIAMKKIVLVFGFLLLSGAAFISCSQEDQNPNPVNSPAKGGLVLTGRIVNENGQGLAGASIIAGGMASISTADGFFRMEGLEELSGNCLVSAPGFADRDFHFCASADKQVNIEIKLQTKADCKKASMGNFEINGDGFHHQSMKIGDRNEASVGIYSQDGNNTYFTMRSADGSSIAGVFPGKIANTGSLRSSMTINLNGKSYVSDSEVKISVTEYGQPGKKIKGFFSGRFRRYDVDLTSGTPLEFSMNIQNGSFDVVRQADI